MRDDLQAMTAELATNPKSLVFLNLGEALRRRGQLDAALAVGEAGLLRYPSLPDAHDLVGRIRSDRGEGDEAFDAWTVALRLDPVHAGALRGLAFLAFREGDLDRAERHLRVALGITPDDPSLRVALQKVVQRGGDRTLSPRPSPLKDGEQSLLVDGRGRMFGGRLRGLDGSDVSEMVAAELAGVMREAGRVTRMLALGAWRGLSVECGGSGALAHLAPPTDSTVLLLMGEPGMPVGRLALEAEAQAEAARRWLERYQ